jgi:hypothetical protein
MMANYNHTQSTGSTTWTINHNLNTQAVTVDTYVLNGSVVEKILPLDVVNTSDNTTVVTFTTSRTGNARVVA